MQLTFLGGADEVGASSTLIEMGGKRILVDAGIRISPRTNRGIQNDQLPDLHPISERGGPDYVLVTHAHTDHTGALPLILEQYPHVPVLGTIPTFVLTRILQKDAQRIMKSRHEQEGELPIFDEVASQRLMDAFQQVDFRQPIRLGEGLQVTYHPAGHIAGAAMLVFEGEEGVLVMSGDVSMNDQRAVVSAQMPNIKADALVLESTYGGKLHANRLAEERRLIETLKEVIERGGTALIPAFALGRAQEVIQILLAYRDQLDVPVYVDGMVRAVCEGYHNFQDLLPKSSVRAAGDKHLFFREKVKPVQSRAMREQIANASQPSIIVASSGMLTGGASVAYAKALAGDKRNAIFLTGYQDEEAPGRFLQRLMRERQENESTTWKIDGKAITLRCQIGTYSLSAHADEQELINMAEAYEAKEIMLVHGDPGARHSLATGLRQRGRRAITPRIGQTESFKFKKRPWAIGQVKSGSETRPLDPEALWDAVKGQAGSFYGARELAQMWWGDAERADEAVRILDNSVYFAADWRRKNTFQIRSEQQVERTLRRRAIMLAHPDLVGKLIVMRDSNNRPRVAVVRAASEDAFEAAVQNTKGQHHPADALLWVIGDWAGYPPGNPAKKGLKSQLNELARSAKSHQDTLLPFRHRQQIVASGQPIKPESLMPDVLPADVSEHEALVGIVLALAGDGAVVEQGGLLPKRALEDGPMEQNHARETAFTAFPPDARLRKVGMEIHRKRLTLTFDFPDRAQSQYAEELEQLEDQTGWDVRVKPGVNQQALGFAVNELLEEHEGVLVKGPSFYMDRSEVGVHVERVDDVNALRQDFMDLTGFRLVTSQNITGGDSDNGTADAAVQPENTNQMEINASYGLVRVTLEPHGLYKVGLKQGQLVLTFISPQVGDRHRETIADLAEKTGYPMIIHPHPNQQMISQVASKLARDAGWSIRKGPGIHVEQGAVSFKLAEVPDEVELAQVNEKFHDETGFHLIVSE
jgi:uncharacterized protein